MSGWNVVIAFGAGHAIVGGFIYLIYRFITQGPDLMGRRTAIQELVDRSARVEATNEELVRSRDEMKQLVKRHQSHAETFNNRIALPSTPSTMPTFAALSLLFVELEALVFYILSVPSRLLGLEPVAWAFLAFPVSAGWILILHVLMGAAFTDASRPARTLRRARIGAVATGATVIFGMWLVLAGRNFANDPHLVETLTGFGLMLLAALVSVCGAFCSIVASTVRDADSMLREDRQLDVSQTLYARHIAILEGELSALGRAPATESQQAKKNDLPEIDAIKPNGGSKLGIAKPGVTVPFLMVFLAVVTSTTPARAQTLNEFQSRVSSLQAEPQGFFARKDACEVLVDVSGSVDRKAKQVLLTSLSGQLIPMTTSLKCELMRLVSFADMPVISLEEFPITSVTPADCSSAKRNAPSAATMAIGDIYPSVAEARQKEAVAECLAREQARVDIEGRQRRATLAQTAEHLRTMAMVGAQGSCTDVAWAVERSLLRSEVVIAITDGISTCSPPRSSVTTSADAQLIFVLLPSAPTTNNSRGLPPIREVERTFPKAQTIFAQEATASFWSRLVRR